MNSTYLLEIQDYEILYFCVNLILIVDHRLAFDYPKSVETRLYYHKIDVITCDMITKVCFPPIRYLLFIIILISSSLLSALVYNNRISASTTTLEPKHS